MTPVSDTKASVHTAQVLVEMEPSGYCQLNWDSHNSPVMNCALPFPKLQSAAEFVTIETMTSFGSMAQLSFSSRQSSA